MKSGMLAAEAVFDLVLDSREHESESSNCSSDSSDNSNNKPFANYESVMLGKGPASMTHVTEAVDYETNLHQSWVADELRVARNSHASFHSPLGLAGGMVHTALSCFITRVRVVVAVVVICSIAVTSSSTCNSSTGSRTSNNNNNTKAIERILELAWCLDHLCTPSASLNRILTIWYHYMYIFH